MNEPFNNCAWNDNYRHFADDLERGFERAGRWIMDRLPAATVATLFSVSIIAAVISPSPSFIERTTASRAAERPVDKENEVCGPLCHMQIVLA